MEPVSVGGQSGDDYPDWSAEGNGARLDRNDGLAQTGDRHCPGSPPSSLLSLAQPASAIISAIPRCGAMRLGRRAAFENDLLCRKLNGTLAAELRRAFAVV